MSDTTEIVNETEKTFHIGDTDYGTWLNIFHVYYKRLFNKKESTYIFADIEDAEHDTNRELELFFEALHDYKLHQADDEYIELYKPNSKNDNTHIGEIYALDIDGHILYMSYLILPLIQFLATQKWVDINWNIFRIKSADETEEVEDFVDTTIRLNKEEIEKDEKTRD